MSPILRADLELAKTIIDIIKATNTDTGLRNYYEINNLMLINMVDVLVNQLERAKDDDEILKEVIVQVFKGYELYSRLYSTLLKVVQLVNLTALERAKLIFMMQSEILKNTDETLGIVANLSKENDYLKEQLFRQSLLIEVNQNENKYKVVVTENRRLAKELEQLKAKQRKQNIIKAIFTEEKLAKVLLGKPDVVKIYKSMKREQLTNELLLQLYDNRQGVSVQDIAIEYEFSQQAIKERLNGMGVL
ncbi:MAG: hypothetical protein ABFC94_00170 [Syntrophomonas sp.]